MNKNTSFLIVFILFIFFNHIQNKNVLWYKTLANNWNEALPIGNGRIGDILFGGTLKIRTTERLLHKNGNILKKASGENNSPFYQASKIKTFRSALLQPLRYRNKQGHTYEFTT